MSARTFTFVAENDTPVILPIPGGVVDEHRLLITVAGAVTGTVVIAWRDFNDAGFTPLAKANPFTLVNSGAQVNGPPDVSAYQFTFSGMAPGFHTVQLALNDSEFPAGAFSGLRALTTQPYTEANVKNGRQYYLRAVWSTSDPIVSDAAPGGANCRKVWFRTGDEQVLVKLREVHYIAEEMTIQIFINPTGVTGGTDLTLHNYNGVNPVTPAGAIAAKKNVTAATNGIEIDGGDLEYLFGASSTANRVQSAIPAGRERVLPPNTEFLVVISNLSTGGQPARAQYFLDFYIGAPDLPL